MDIVKNILKDNGLPYEDLESSLLELFLAYENSGFVGVIGLERFEDVGLLRSMVVDAKFRNKGCGTQIYKKFLAQIPDIKQLYLLTCTAKDFFEMMGFEVISRENVPDCIKTTAEFSSLCPYSAICMRIYNKR